MTPWDVFISHASEDKDSFVQPLAEGLQRLAVRVWYDRFTLIPGDRLSESIGEGLSQSRCGLVVISQNFLKKAWTKYELSGLVNRFVEENMRLIPIWLGVSRSAVASVNPSLADLVAIRGTPEDVGACTIAVLKVVRPQLYSNLRMTAGLRTAEVTIESRKLADLEAGPIRHHDLPAPLLIRIQNVFFAVQDVLNLPLSRTIENFQRDLDPAGEVEVWERMVSAMNKALHALGKRDVPTKKQVFSTVLGLANGGSKSILAQVQTGQLSPEIVTAVADAMRDAVPPVTVSDVEVE